MKITASRAEGFIKSPDPKVRAILVYGPDEGLVRERIDRLTLGVVSDKSDPFRVADLTPAALKDNPARLADEAAAISMLGGRRVVILRDAGDTLTKTIDGFLANPMGDALVLVEGGDLSARSSLRKLFETHDLAAAIPCYADEGHSLQNVIADALRQAQLTFDPDVMAYLMDNLGGDRRLTRSELDKLILFKGGPGKVTLEDAMACIGDTAALSLDDLAQSCANGDHLSAQRVLDRLFREGVNAIPILRSLQRYFQRLHLAAGHMGLGKSTDSAIASLRPPPMFKVADAFKRQLGRWPLDKLSRALELIIEAEADCKSTGAPVQEICSRLVMQLCQAAGKSNRH